MKKKTITLLFTILIVAVLFAAGFKIIVEENKCVGCEDCTLVCPTNAIDMTDGKAVIDQSKCIKCDICVPQCTYEAIKKVK